MAQLKRHILANDQLLLPMATVLETGNHIGQIRQSGRTVVDVRGNSWKSFAVQ